MRKTTLFSMLFIGVLVGVFFIPNVANAATFTVFQAELLTFVELDDDPATCCTLVGPVASGTGVQITQTHDSTVGVGPPTQQRVGVDKGADTDLSAFTDFQLVVTNNNDDSWQYRLWMADLAGEVTDLTSTAEVSAYTYVAPGGGTSLLTLALPGGLDLTKIRGYGIDIKMASFGGSDCDELLCGGETAIRPIPEPATVLLMGSGLLGLVGIGRRRMRRRAA